MKYISLSENIDFIFLKWWLSRRFQGEMMNSRSKHQILAQTIEIEIFLCSLPNTYRHTYTSQKWNETKWLLDEIFGEFLIETIVMLKKMKNILLFTIIEMLNSLTNFIIYNK